MPIERHAFRVWSMLMDSALIEHLARGMRYDRWAQDELVRSFGELIATDDRLRRWHAHVVGAQRVWLDRLLAAQIRPPVIHPDWDFAESERQRRLLEHDLAAMLARVRGLPNNADLDYISLSRGPQRSPVVEVLAHVVNHGSHHRGQMCARVKELGRVPPILDRIAWPG